MMPEGGFGPPPQEPYVDSLQSLINSAASWSFSRASWLLPASSPCPQPLSLDDNSASDSRKNSYYSTSTNDTYVSDDRLASLPALAHMDEHKSLWRSLVHSAGSPTPQYATWESALSELNVVLQAIRDGTAHAVEATMVVHAIFLAAGLPAGCTTDVKPLRNLHCATRDAAILLHVMELRNRPLDSASEQFGKLASRFVEEAKKRDELPRFQTEYLVSRNNGIVSLVSELGVPLREMPEVSTSVVEIPCCRDLEHLLALAKGASSMLSICDVLDKTGICRYYYGCSSLGNDPAGCDMLSDFLECRIKSHIALLDGTCGPGDALEVLSKLAWCPVDAHPQESCASSTAISSQAAAVAAAAASVKSQALFSRTGGLRGGNKHALVEQVTRHDQRPEIVHPFLITFSAFMTELELLELLEERYDIQPRATLDTDAFNDWNSTVRPAIRARVVSVVRTWISQNWLRVCDGEATAHRQTLLTRLRSFAKRTGNGPLIRAVEGIQGKEEIPDIADLSTEVPIRPECSAKEFAANMTFIKFQKYSKVTPQCLLWRQIGRYPSDRDTPLTRYINHWNEESNWVSHDILSLQEADDRARKLEFFIDVCVELRNLNNYSSLMAVLSAFASAGIFRLKNTWARVSPEKEEALDKLKTLMDSSCNFNNYREVLWLMADNCVPFIGLCLTDLQYTYDGNEDYLNGNIHLINFAKWSVIAGIIEGATRFRGNPPVLPARKDVTDWIQYTFPRAPALSDQYQDSLAAEPRLLSRSRGRRSAS